MKGFEGLKALIGVIALRYILIAQYIIKRRLLGLLTIRVNSKKGKIIVRSLKKDTDLLLESYRTDAKYYNVCLALREDLDIEELKLPPWKKVHDKSLKTAANRMNIHKKNLAKAIQESGRNLGKIEGKKIFLDKKYYERLRNWINRRDNILDMSFELANLVLEQGYIFRIDSYSGNQEVLNYVIKEIMDLVEIYANSGYSGPRKIPEVNDLFLLSYEQQRFMAELIEDKGAFEDSILGKFYDRFLLEHPEIEKKLSEAITNKIFDATKLVFDGEFAFVHFSPSELKSELEAFSTALEKEEFGSKWEAADQLGDFLVKFAQAGVQRFFTPRKKKTLIRTIETEQKKVIEDHRDPFFPLEIAKISLKSWDDHENPFLIALFLNSLREASIEYGN